MSGNHRALDENDIAMIELVKMTPSLYDPRNVDFRTAHRKDQDWDKVATSLGINVADAKRRWTCLRDRYSRELKLIRLHPGRNCNYGKNEFFRSMDFLRCFVRKRRERRSTVSNKTEDSFWDTTSNANSNERTYEAKLISVESVAKQEIDKYDEYADSSNGSNYETKLNMTEETVEFPEYMQGNTETYELVETTEPHESLETPIIQKHNLQNSPESFTNKVSNTTESTISTSRDATKLQKNENTLVMETEDDYFCKSVAVYLRQLSRRHKIKAKVEMFQILEKYIEIEESQLTST